MIKIPSWIRGIMPRQRQTKISQTYPLKGKLSHMITLDISAVLKMNQSEPRRISMLAQNGTITIRLHYTDKIAVVFDLDRRPIFSVENHSTNLDPKHNFHFLDVTARIWYIGDGYSAIFNLTLVPTDIQVISNSLPSRTILLDMTRS
jgi:hypothetical protein